MSCFNDELTNFGKETREILNRYGYNEKDIAFIVLGNGNKTTNIKKFFAIADSINYDDGYGAQEINPELAIYLNDGNYFERKEYDGSEWWDYVQCGVPDAFDTDNFNADTLLTPDYY